MRDKAADKYKAEQRAAKHATKQRPARSKADSKAAEQHKAKHEAKHTVFETRDQGESVKAMTQDKGLTSIITQELLAQGADLVGTGSLMELPAKERKNMPLSISVVVKYPSAVIQGISELPTQEYCDWYDLLNERLDAAVTHGAEKLRQLGYHAIAQTRAEVGNGEAENNTTLPHKTVATRAGIGWIGKSALLVTRKYGSMVRLSSILTDAPLEVAEPVNRSECGSCMICANACPAGAISGKEWELGLYRDEFFDPIQCRVTAQERAKRGFGGGHTICGKCIEVCPYTRKAWSLPN